MPYMDTDLQNLVDQSLVEFEADQVLVIDDDAIIGNLIRKFLERECYL